MAPEIKEQQEQHVRGIPTMGISGITASVRLAEWFKPKASNLLALLYSAILIAGLAAFHSLFLLIPSVITVLGIGSFGHIINDWYDIEADARAGKSNRLGGLSRGRRLALLLTAIAIGLVPWLVLPFDAFSIALLLSEFILLLVYVQPPVRLKERRVWSLLADGAYAYAIPAVLAAHTLFLAGHRPDDAMFVASLVAWQLSLGIRHYLNHVALDRYNDLATGTPTMATHKGNRYIHDLIRRVVLPVEVAGFLAYLFAMSKYTPFLAPIIGIVFVLSSLLHVVLSMGRGYPLFPYRFSKTHMDRLYQDVLPLTLLLLLVLRDWRYGLLLSAHVILFYGIESGSLTRLVLREICVWGSRVLGAPIMLLRARSLPKDSLKPGTTKHRKRVNVAIANINKGKYTETFVTGLISRLNCNVYYLHGGELPMFDDVDRPFLSNWTSVRYMAYILELALGNEKNHFLKNSIAYYLQSKHIELVLAQFGPVGVAMLPITRDLGIPLIVYFHAYDVFHKETLRQYAPGYPALFREAALIIGVSEKVLDHLQQLGAPRDKLVHLPAFVRLDLFSYTDHSAVSPRFLAVGRFAETKSPHLTILAFHRVAQIVPRSVLVMAGKGGGGELFEACLILARALGVEKQIEFKGVLSHQEVAIEMQRARVFVQHSVTTPENGDMEGKPVAIMEAMASGLPVVATHHSGIVELIQHDVTGFLVPEYDIQAMADTMIRLAGDDELVGRVGRNASAAIHNHPLISRHVEILEDLIERTVSHI